MQLMMKDESPNMMFRAFFHVTSDRARRENVPRHILFVPFFVGLQGGKFCIDF